VQRGHWGSRGVGRCRGSRGRCVWCATQAGRDVGALGSVSARIARRGRVVAPRWRARSACAGRPGVAARRAVGPRARLPEHMGGCARVGIAWERGAARERENRERREKNRGERERERLRLLAFARERARRAGLGLGAWALVGRLVRL
jgi:hypothetical protein